MALARTSVVVGDTSFDAVVLGEGEPTVVFVNGLGSPLEEWTFVAPAIAEKVRVVCYDRRTAPAKGPVVAHDATSISVDLHALLQALGVDGPLVLVGHSWGGAVIRQYVLDHPGDVVGLVYVDASHQDIKGMIPNRSTKLLYTASTSMLRIGPVRRRLLRTLGFEHLPADVLATVNGLGWVGEGRTSRAEYAGIGSSLLALRATAPELPQLPSAVLLAGGRPGLTTKLGKKQMGAIRSVWEKAVAGRPDIRFTTVTGSGHYICLDAPDAVIEAVEEVLARVSPARTPSRPPG